jgi:WD40 repeat protein
MKFVTASEDKNLKIWDFEKGKIEKELKGKIIRLV